MHFDLLNSLQPAPYLALSPWLGHAVWAGSHHHPLVGQLMPLHLFRYLGNIDYCAWAKLMLLELNATEPWTEWVPSAFHCSTEECNSTFEGSVAIESQLVRRVGGNQSHALCCPHILKTDTTEWTRAISSCSISESSHKTIETSPKSILFLAENRLFCDRLQVSHRLLKTSDRAVRILHLEHDAKSATNLVFEVSAHWLIIIYDSSRPHHVPVELQPESEQTYVPFLAFWLDVILVLLISNGYSVWI